MPHKKIAPFLRILLQNEFKSVNLKINQSVTKKKALTFLQCGYTEKMLYYSKLCALCFFHKFDHVLLYLSLQSQRKKGRYNCSTLAMTIVNFRNIKRSAITYSNMWNAEYENVFCSLYQIFQICIKRESYLYQFHCFQFHNF